MKKYFKRKGLSAAPQDEAGADDPIDKMQQQLNAIERKLDILISQSSSRPFEKSYSQRPSQRFGQYRHHDEGRQGNDLRERTYTRVICADCKKECEVPFKPSAGRPVYCKECFSNHKKDNLFSGNRDNRPEERDFPRERHFDKRQTEKRQKPARGKKPFFHQRKKQA